MRLESVPSPTGHVAKPSARRCGLRHDILRIWAVAITCAPCSRVVQRASRYSDASTGHALRFGRRGIPSRPGRRSIVALRGVSAMLEGGALSAPLALRHREAFDQVKRVELTRHARSQARGAPAAAFSVSSAAFGVRSAAVAAAGVSTAVAGVSSAAAVSPVAICGAIVAVMRRILSGWSPVSVLVFSLPRLEHMPSVLETGRASEYHRPLASLVGIVCGCRAHVACSCRATVTRS
mmetsp:Transcript_44027/g.115677  ORF Transcript_44027/g.115677 Transcript_44027/m.115677 type:complete len:236 (+) Transcript_44027:116-823(+)